MSTLADAGVVVLLAGALVFFCAGTLGLLRFPDTLGRLHALTKADNVGLGLLVTALALEAGDLRVSVELLFIWILVMLSGATACHLLASRLAEAASRDRTDGDER